VWAFIGGLIVGVFAVLELLDGVEGVAELAGGMRDGWRKFTERIG
jgi:hypothetical protein